MADYLSIVQKITDLSKANQKIRLIAVSKLQSIDSILDLYNKNQIDFGENYVQEFLQKKETIDQKKSENQIRWHFIGSLQKNKVGKIVGHTYLIHSVDSLSLLQTIQRHAQNKSMTQKVLIQVNLSGEVTKSGFTKHDLLAQKKEIFNMANIEVVGLMTMPPLENDANSNRKYFSELRCLRDQFQLEHPTCVELSMGTSHDYLVAVEEGATMVRLGTVVFGERKRP